jgi:hypothetical protein
MRTPLYNVFDLMRRPKGRRVLVTVAGDEAIDSDGVGLGAEATRDSHRAWVLAWNYRNTANDAHGTTAIFEFDNLAAAGIKNGEWAEVRMRLVDRDHGNVAVGDHSGDGLEVVSVYHLTPGAIRYLEIELGTNATALLEIVPGRRPPGEGGTVAGRPTPSIGSDSTTRIVNGGFEGGLHGWIPGRPGATVRLTTAPRRVAHGSAALHVSASELRHEIARQTVPIRAGRSYEFAGSIRLDPGTDRAFVSVQFRDASGNSLLVTPIKVVEHAPSYRRDAKVLRAPPGSVETVVRLVVGPGVGAADFDDISVRQIDSAPDE